MNDTTKLVDQVTSRLIGKQSRHEKAEARRDVICSTIHRWELIRGMGRKVTVLRRLAKHYEVSVSTIRTIHTQHCREKKTGVVAGAVE